MSVLEDLVDRVAPAACASLLVQTQLHSRCRYQVRRQCADHEDQNLDPAGKHVVVREQLATGFLKQEVVREELERERDVAAPLNP